MLLSSAVRLPTPPPGGSYSPGPSNPRKRSPPSRSPSPRRRRSPPVAAGPNGSKKMDENREPDERERMLQERFRSRAKDDARRKPMTEEEKQAAAKAEYEKLLNMRSGGTYIPPARLRALQSQITDKTSKEYQRMAWEALKKSINGLINKVNVSNIKHIVPELFAENLVRGRGLFCRSIMKAQAASLPFTPIYAAMAAIVNTKLPQVGELLLKRLIMQFRKAFRRNDKAVCISSTTFIAHLCNQQVAHANIAAEIFVLLLSKPTDDSVEIAVGLAREVGQILEELHQPIALAIFDQFRSILHEADIDKRTQYMTEVLFQVRKDKYKDNPAIREELDLVEEEDQITHSIDLDEMSIDVEDGLNVFKYDAEYEEHEEAYRKLKAEILGEGSDDEEYESGADADSSDDEEAEKDRAMEIKDKTNTDLVNLRRTIYLTIQSSLNFEEACHKLMKVQLPPGQEAELPSMIVESCSQEKTYSKFFGLVGERFAKLNRLWTDLFEQSFAKYYDTIHRYETNRLRNIARFFGHLLATEAIGWHVFSVVHLNEDETTSSSRIFVKILFQDLAEAMGIPQLQQRMKDDILRPSYEGLFPMDPTNPRNTRFSINYFTSIGMGALTEGMREHLKNLPQPAPPPALPPPRSRSESVSSYSSYSSYSSKSVSPSRSPPRRSIENGRTRGRSSTRSASGSRSPSPRRRRERNYSSSITSSRSPSRRRARDRSAPRSRSPSTADERRRQPTTRRGRSLTRSVSRSTVSRSPPRKKTPLPRRPKPSLSRSRSPPPQRNGTTSTSYRPQRRQPYSRSASASRSPPPSYRSRPRRSVSRSASPPPRRAPPRDAGSGRPRERSATLSRSPTRSLSPSPPRRSARRERRNTTSGSERSLSRSRSPPTKTRVRHNDRYRRDSSVDSRKRARRSPSHEIEGRNTRGREDAATGSGGGRRAKASDFL